MNKESNTIDALILSSKKYFSAMRKKMWSYNGAHLNIRVSEELEDRAFRFVIALNKALEERAHHITIKHGYWTYAVIFEEELEFYIREVSTVVKESTLYNSRELAPTGRLAFKYKHYRLKESWQDASGLLIEDKISDIVAYFEKQAIKIKQDREKYEKYKRKREMEEQRECKRQERKEKELAKFNELLALSNRYQKAIELRNYIEMVKSNAVENDNLSKKLQAWIDWAMKKVDWLDPFVNALDEYLDDSDKDKINI